MPDIQLRYISLGAGVQSTVLALLMSESKEADCAIFADTGWEPAVVYTHLDWLEGQLSFPVYRVKHAGISLKEAVRTGYNHNGYKYLEIPAYIDGEKRGMGFRQCTTNYKIIPIERQVRKLLGKTRVMAQEPITECFLGISTDEVVRMKASRVPWIRNRYPLIEAGMSRRDCYNWFKDRYPDQLLVKSSCVGCPYHSRSQWVRIKQDTPEEFAEACVLDEGIRHHRQWATEGKGEVRKPAFLYLHSSFLPLAEAVARDEFKTFLNDPDGFGNECEGHCGV